MILSFENGQAGLISPVENQNTIGERQISLEELGSNFARLCCPSV